MTVLVIGGCFWLAGFAIYANSIKPSLAAPQDADAIVALTGGEERISEAIKLLQQQKGSRLLISGVHPDTSGDDIRGLVNAPEALFTCCIDLGRTAADTIGNAEETALWAEERGYSSLIIVTQSYHIPRSLIEFRRVMPELELIPYSIASQRFPTSEWWQGGKAGRFLASEYNKYLASLIRIRLLSLFAT
jgi:uncharacterized SAM-binding protein YcdF (DUF218 family)